MGFLKRFFSFLEEEEDDEDDESVIDTLAKDHIMPYVSDMVLNIVTDVMDGFKDIVVSAVENIFSNKDDTYFIGSRRRGHKRYSKVSNRRNSSSSRDKGYRKKKHRPDPCEVEFDSQKDAVDCKNALIDIFENNDEVTVADFYDTANDYADYEEDLIADNSDEEYGWDGNPKHWMIKRRNGAYVISTPKIRRLE